MFLLDGGKVNKNYATVTCNAQLSPVSLKNPTSDLRQLLDRNSMRQLRPQLPFVEAGGVEIWSILCSACAVTPPPPHFHFCSVQCVGGYKVLAPNCGSNAGPTQRVPGPRKRGLRSRREDKDAPAAEPGWRKGVTRN